jgi:uncharacterized protein
MSDAGPDGRPSYPPGMAGDSSARGDDAAHGHGEGTDGPLTTSAPLQVLDTAALWRWARLVAARLEGARAELDALNVFPVPDGDTGTNLALSVRGALDSTEASGDDLARALLVSARGNSGVIASQLVRGWADVLGARGQVGAEPVTGPVVAKALRRGDDLAWAAVTEPVEGTVLSVSRAAAAAADRVASTGAPLAEVVHAVVAEAEAALDRTPLQLPALAAAGVVDAGGAGLLVALRALADVVDAGPDGEAALPVDLDDGRGLGIRGSGTVTGGGSGTGADEHLSALGVAGVDLDPSGPAYEVMYLVATDQDAGVDDAAGMDGLRAELTGLGDSVLVVGGGGLWHVHVHTDDPGAAVEAGLAAGRPRAIRITHFAAAAAAAAARGGGEKTPGGHAEEPAALAVVACAGGAATVELCEQTGALVVPSAPGERASTGDVLRAVLAAGVRAGRVLVLPNDAETAAVAHQAALAAEEEGVTAVVARSRSQVQVLAALAVVGAGAPAGGDALAAIRSAVAAVDGCRHGAVAVAARGSATPAGPCRVGDVVGTVGRDVVAVGPDAAQVAGQVVEHMGGPDLELVTVVPGQGEGTALADVLREQLAASRPQVRVDVVGGGQPRYLLLLGCE